MSTLLSLQFICWGALLCALVAPAASFSPSSIVRHHRTKPLSLQTSLSVTKFSTGNDEYSGESKLIESRRDCLKRSIATSATLLSILSPSRPAHAAYGDAPKQEGFNYIEFLIEKNKIANPDDFLYKGTDSAIQLQRILEASQRLNDIPTLVEKKKWSQVQGIVTGPLGTLLPTMTFVVGSIKGDGVKEAKVALGKVKGDIIRIGQEAAKKSDTGCITATQQALTDLEAFVKIAF